MPPIDLSDEVPFETKVLMALTEIRTEQQNFRKELTGNGQPGRIQVIEAKVSRIETWMTSAGWKTTVILVGAILSLLVSLAAFTVNHPQEKPSAYIQQSKP